MDYSLKFSNLLKKISTKLQQDAQTIDKKEKEKTETLFDFSKNQGNGELNSDDLFGGMISLSKSAEPLPKAADSVSMNDVSEDTAVQKQQADTTGNTVSKLSKLLNNIKLTTGNTTVANNDAVQNNDEVVPEEPEVINVSLTRDNTKLFNTQSALNKVVVADESKAVNTAEALTSRGVIEEDISVEPEIKYGPIIEELEPVPTKFTVVPEPTVSTLLPEPTPAPVPAEPTVVPKPTVPTYPTCPTAPTTPTIPEPTTPTVPPEPTVEPEPRFDGVFEGNVEVVKNPDGSETINITMTSGSTYMYDGVVVSAANGEDTKFSFDVKPDGSIVLNGDNLSIKAQEYWVSPWEYGNALILKSNPFKNLTIKGNNNLIMGSRADDKLTVEGNNNTIDLAAGEDSLVVRGENNVVRNVEDLTTKTWLVPAGEKGSLEFFENLLDIKNINSYDVRYDSEGRVSDMFWVVSDVNNPTYQEDIHISYNENGSFEVIIDDCMPERTFITKTFDASNQLFSEVDKKYDLNNNLVNQKESYQYSHGLFQYESDYSYDSENRLILEQRTTLRDGKVEGSYRQEFNYDSAGRTVLNRYIEFNADGNMLWNYTYENSYYDNGTLKFSYYNNQYSDGSYDKGASNYYENGGLKDSAATQYDADGLMTSNVLRKYDESGALVSTEGKQVVKANETDYIWANGKDIRLTNKNGENSEVSYTIDANGHMELNANGMEIGQMQWIHVYYDTNVNQTTDETAVVDEIVKYDSKYPVMPLSPKYWGVPMTDIAINGNNNTITGTQLDDNISVYGNNNVVDLGEGEDALNIVGNNNRIKNVEDVSMNAKPEVPEGPVVIDGKEVLKLGANETVQFAVQTDKGLQNFEIKSNENQNVEIAYKEDGVIVIYGGNMDITDLDGHDDRLYIVGTEVVFYAAGGEDNVTIHADNIAVAADKAESKDQIDNFRLNARNSAVVGIAGGNTNISVEADAASINTGDGNQNIIVNAKQAEIRTGHNGDDYINVNAESTLIESGNGNDALIINQSGQTIVDKGDGSLSAQMLSNNINLQSNAKMNDISIYGENVKINLANENADNKITTLDVAAQKGSIDSQLVSALDNATLGAETISHTEEVVEIDGKFLKKVTETITHEHDVNGVTGNVTINMPEAAKMDIDITATADKMKIGILGDDDNIEVNNSYKIANAEEKVWYEPIIKPGEKGSLEFMTKLLGLGDNDITDVKMDSDGRAVSFTKNYPIQTTDIRLNRTLGANYSVKYNADGSFEVVQDNKIGHDAVLKDNDGNLPEGYIASDVTTMRYDANNTLKDSKNVKTMGRGNRIETKNIYRPDGGTTIMETKYDAKGIRTENTYINEWEGTRTVRVESGYDENGENPAKDFLTGYDANGNVNYTVEENFKGYAHPTVTEEANDGAQISFGNNKYLTINTGDKAVINADGTVEIKRADNTFEVYDKTGTLIRIDKPEPKFGSIDWLKNVLGEEFANNAFNSVSCDNQGRIVELIPYDVSSPKFKGDGKTYRISYADDGSSKVAASLDGITEVKYFDKLGKLIKTEVIKPEQPIIKPGEKGSLEYAAKLLGMDPKSIVNPQYDEEGRLLEFALDDGMVYAGSAPSYIATYDENNVMTITQRYFNETTGKYEETVVAKDSLVSIEPQTISNTVYSKDYNVETQDVPKFDENGNRIYDYENPYHENIKYDENGNIIS